jgi:hypothetical protein
MRIKIPWRDTSENKLHGHLLRSKLLDLAKGRLDACTEAADVRKKPWKKGGKMGIDWEHRGNMGSSIA